MNFDWQAVAAPAIVFAAVAYLSRIFYRKWVRVPKSGENAGCGACGSCSNANSRVASEPVVIDITSPRPRLPR